MLTNKFMKGRVCKVLVFMFCILALVFFTPKVCADGNTTTQVTITFDANGGTGSMDPQQVEKGEYRNLKKNNFTAPNDKTFVGWNTEKTGGSGEYYCDEQIVNLQGDLTLYAQWADAVTITYDANGEQVAWLLS